MLRSRILRAHYIKKTKQTYLQSSLNALKSVFPFYRGRIRRRETFKFIPHRCLKMYM
jgi:hypothetical protein